MYTKFFPDRLDALPLAVRDLNATLAWAAARPDVRLQVTSDDTMVKGVIQVHPWGSSWPRWCMWRSQDGRLQIDDLTTADFALPYPTVHMALRFFASKL